MTSKDNRSGPGALSTDAAFDPSKADQPRPDRDPTGNTLQQRAEEITSQKSPHPCKNPEAFSREEIIRSTHELQVHRIQLEMQNEELRRQQLELEAAQARYFDFYDQAPLGYCTLSEHGLILEANLTTASLLGVARGALLMQPMSRYIHNESQDTYYLHRNKLFTSGEPQICQLRMVKTDGTPIWANLHAIATQNDEKKRICRLVITDITEHRLADNALRETNTLLSLFMQYTPIYTFIKEVTPDESRVVMASENFRDMVGIPGSAMVGKTMAELFPAEFAATITADDWAVVAEGKMLTLDEQLNNRSYITIKYPVVLSDKKLLAGYTIDITERKQADEEKAKLEAMNRQLQKVESLGRMAGAVAHHFNNKLHVVMGYLELIKSDLTQGVDCQSSLAEAMQAADQAAEVSRMLLTYLGQVTGKQEPLDLAEICRKWLPLIEATIPKGVVLETEIRTPGPPVKANANQIRQILTNLVTNAWESAGDHPRCTIHLSVKTVSSADIDTVRRYPVNWQPSGSAYGCLEVRDNGSGIGIEDLEELFSPFFSTKFTGRGLGLPMVLGLVQAHSGGITVESSPGSGSLFRVFLPISDEEQVMTGSPIPNGARSFL